MPEAAAISGLSVDTLKRLAGDGELTILRLSPRRVGIRLTELKRFMAERERVNGIDRLRTYKPRITKLKALEHALERLVYHDRAAARREGLEGCLELQQAEELLRELEAGRK
jgi:hypothetical protein